ncbi:hypothetical protein LJK87_17070 [Paenibacillus sp. P25]|nr:hypothetical protein LJK87_17070 [Paenibacillus sp. P25]
MDTREPIEERFLRFQLEAVRTVFRREGPFPGPSGSSEPMGWVENYVKDVMKQALPSVDLDNLKHHFHTEVFDTHNNVIVKVHIPDRAEAQKVRVKLSSNQVRLDGYAE